MTRSRTYRFILLLLSSLVALTGMAQTPEEEATAVTDTVEVSADNVAEALGLKEKEEKAPIFSGIAVSADMVGLFMKLMDAKYANMEVAGRLNFKEKYFPICEMGIGSCDKVGGDNNNHFNTTAPYFRVGIDYNINEKLNGNRFFIGLRYAFSSFNYDFSNPDYYDPVWKRAMPLDVKSVNDKMQWIELAVGVETKLWSIVRLGWSLRYRGRLKQSIQEMGEPWYVPGYGKNQGFAWGGTVNLIFDVGKTAKEKKKK